MPLSLSASKKIAFPSLYMLSPAEPLAPKFSTFVESVSTWTITTVLFNWSPSCHTLFLSSTSFSCTSQFSELSVFLLNMPSCLRKVSKLLSFQPFRAESSHLHFWSLTANAPFLFTPLFPVLTVCISPASGYIRTPGSQRLHWI